MPVATTVVDRDKTVKTCSTRSARSTRCTCFGSIYEHGCFIMLIFCLNTMTKWINMTNTCFDVGGLIALIAWIAVIAMIAMIAMVVFPQGQRVVGRMIGRT